MAMVKKIDRGLYLVKPHGKLESLRLATFMRKRSMEAPIFKSKKQAKFIARVISSKRRR